MDSTDTGQNVAGEGQYSHTRLDDYALLITGDKIVHAKVTRHIAAVYGVHQWHLEFLCALQVWSRMTGKGGGQACIGWTGARGRWIKKMKEGMREAQDLGTVELVPYGSGHATKITQKGLQVMEAYRRRFIDITAGILAEIDRQQTKQQAA